MGFIKPAPLNIKRSAAKALKKIPKPDRKRVSEKIDSLAKAYFPQHKSADDT